MHSSLVVIALHQIEIRAVCVKIPIACSVPQRIPLTGSSKEVYLDGNGVKLLQDFKYLILLLNGMISTNQTEGNAGFVNGKIFLQIIPTFDIFSLKFHYFCNVKWRMSSIVHLVMGKKGRYHCIK